VVGGGRETSAKLSVEAPGKHGRKGTAEGRGWKIHCALNGNPYSVHPLQKSQETSIFYPPHTPDANHYNRKPPAPVNMLITPSPNLSEPSTAPSNFDPSLNSSLASLRIHIHASFQTQLLHTFSLPFLPPPSSLHIPFSYSTTRTHTKTSHPPPHSQHDPDSPDTDSS